MSRPRQVTTAAVLASGGAAALVLSLVETLGSLRSQETRERIQEVLSRPPGSGLGLDVADVLTVMRLTALAAGALAAVALVCGIYLTRRHRGARVALAVAAGLLVLTIPVTGVLPVLVATGAAMAWSRPARDWYDGRAPAPRPAPAAGPPHQPPPARFSPPQPPPPPPPPGPPGPPWATPGRPGPGSPPPALTGPWPAPLPRPATVTWAAVLTWVGAGLVISGMLLVALVLAVGGDAVDTELQRVLDESRLGITRQQLVAATWAVVAVLIGWSVVAAGLAALALRGSNAARWALIVSAVLASLVSLVGVLSLVGLVTLALAAPVPVLLLTGGAPRWYAARSASSPGQISG